MSSEVKEITDVVKELGGLREKAKAVRNKLQSNITAAELVIEQVDKVIADPLADAVLELSSFLKDTTNNPPRDDGGQG